MARTSGGTVASVVMSPQPRSSASARRTISRYERRVQRTERLLPHRAARLARRRQLAKLNLDAQRVAGGGLEPLDVAGGARSASGAVERSDRGVRTLDDETRHRSLQRLLLLRFLLSDFAEHRGHRVQRRAASASGSRQCGQDLARGRPGAAMDGSVFHQDQTSSVAKGRYGASSRTNTDRASRMAALADPAASAPMIAVATRLHQLEIVVAEVTRTTSPSVRARACSCRPSRSSRDLVDESARDA